MQWNKDTLRETRLKVGVSQTALAEALGVHFGQFRIVKKA